VAEEGSLRIGVIASIAGGTSRELLQAFIAAHPGVEVEITEGAARDHFAAVRAMHMDLVFSAGGTPAAGCETGPGWAEPIQVAVPTSHRLAGASSLSWADLADERFIVSKMDPGPEIADCVVRHLTTIGREPMIEPRGVQRDGLLAMVSLGLGIGLFTSAEAHVTHPGVVFIPLEEDWLPFTLVWSAKNDNPALRRFLSLARRETKTLKSQAKAPGAGAPSRTPDPPP
jgi:DNA-binding transcriptional LysR family regulator